MMDYTQLIERLKDADAETVMTTAILEDATDALEALQELVTELEDVALVSRGMLRLAHGERDEALEKLKELEAQEPIAFYTPERMDGFIPASVRIKKDESSNATQLPLYARPIPAESTARTYMDGYSDCKQWAMEQAQPEPHPDDIAVDAMAAAMKDKLRLAREKGRGGWETCSQQDLSRLLREHVEKGDPRDVANFCAFLYALGFGIAQQEPVPITNDQMWAVWDDYYGAIPSYDRPAFEPCLYTNMLAAAKEGAL